MDVRRQATDACERSIKRLRIFSEARAWEKRWIGIRKPEWLSVGYF